MPIEVLQREVWDGTRRKRNLLWFSNQTGTRTREAVLEELNHRFDWELQLMVDGEFLRSHVCRTQEEVFDTIEEWRAAIIEKGWT